MVLLPWFWSFLLCLSFDRLIRSSLLLILHFLYIYFLLFLRLLLLILFPSSFLDIWRRMFTFLQHLLSCRFGFFFSILFFLGRIIALIILFSFSPLFTLFLTVLPRLHFWWHIVFSWRNFGSVTRFDVIGEGVGWLACLGYYWTVQGLFLWIFYVVSIIAIDGNHESGLADDFFWGKNFYFRLLVIDTNNYSSCWNVARRAVLVYFTMFYTIKIFIDFAEQSFIGLINWYKQIF